MKWKWIDADCTSVTTAEGTLTLKGLFIPLFIEQLLMNMTGTVNTLMLGHYADDAVAAVGAANQVIGFLYTFYAVFSGGASVVISHRLGAGDEKRASDAAFTSIVCGGAISLILGTILAFFAGAVMRPMQLETSVYEMAVVYFRICIGFSVLQGIISAISAVLRSYGKPKLAVTVSLFMNIVNAVLNYVVIFQPVKIVPEGVEGIAMANVASHGTALLLGVWFLFHCGLHLDFASKNLKTLSCVGGILKIGLPGGISSLSYSFSQIVSTSILAVLGTAALTAKIHVSSIVFYVYVTGMSLGLLNYDTGFVNEILTRLGMEKWGPYSDPHVWPVLLVIIYLWQQTGYNSVVYFASICGIDAEMIEASKVDGANAFQRIRYILLPSLKPTVIILLLFALGGIVKGNFGLFYNIIGTNSLLYDTTDIIETFVYRATMTDFNFSTASAVGLYQSVVGFVIVMVVNYIVKKIEPDYSLF